MYDLWNNFSACIPAGRLGIEEAGAGPPLIGVQVNLVVRI